MALLELIVWGVVRVLEAGMWMIAANVARVLLVLGALRGDVDADGVAAVEGLAEGALEIERRWRLWRRHI